MDYAIAVFDVGKTNKKLFIYDNSFRQLDSVAKRFDPVEARGIRAEPVEAMEEWLLDELKRFQGQYPIKVISITTHGAATVCVGADGSPSVPAVDYTFDPEDDTRDAFYEEMGDPVTLQQETATTEVQPLVNPGKALFFLKRRFPDDFAKTKHVLFYPQYFGFRLTGQVAADYTYVGCHTYLWNFDTFEYSRVADRLGILELLPQEMKEPWDVLGTVTSAVAERTGLPPDTIVTAGIHDSNASLIPYLLTTTEDFTLNSTGTWCVAMHPSDAVAFTEDELGKSVFYNLSAFGTPVKTSILSGGLEFETYTSILQELNKVDYFPELNLPLYQRAIRRRSHFIFPSILKGAGQFPDSTPRVYEDGEMYSLEEIQAGRRVPEFFFDYPAAYAVLNLSLAIQSKVALERVGAKDGQRIFTEGGFRNNPDYNTLISAAFPGASIALSNMTEATSYGAAIVGATAYEKRPPTELVSRISTDAHTFRNASFEGLDAYIERFMELL
ncbi:MAG: FGGY-family carbohydrate kinase [bacterium]